MTAGRRTARTSVRNLVLILGDQLDIASNALENLDPNQDRVLMIVASGEAQRVWSHKARTGADACPMTTLYWNFLGRNERAAIRRRADALLRNLDFL